MAEGMATDPQDRRQLVTDEPYVLSEEVKGLPLASVRRRAAAYLFDGFLMIVLGTPLLFAFAWTGTALQSRPAADLLVGGMTGTEMSDADRSTALAELLQIVWRHNPGVIPLRFGEALAADDLDAVKAELAEQSIGVMVDMGNNKRTYFDPETNAMYISVDSLMGPTVRVVGVTAIALGFFTVLLFVGRGKTPGKWLFGMRVLRLDGRRLSFLDCVGRAGGYAASSATLGLGFAEAIWDPNRQATHDRIAGTVVVREEKVVPAIPPAVVDESGAGETG